MNGSQNGWYVGWIVSSAVCCVYNQYDNSLDCGHKTNSLNHVGNKCFLWVNVDVSVSYSSRYVHEGSLCFVCVCVIEAYSKSFGDIMDNVGNILKIVNVIIHTLYL